MITDLGVQHELLKTALQATDNYLGMEAKAKAAGTANAATMRDFIYHYDIAHKAFQALGVLSDHEEYMQMHLNDMWKMAKDEDVTLADEPYTNVGGKSEIDESHNPYTSLETTVKTPVVNFSTFLEKKSDELTDQDIDGIVETLDWNDIEDLYEEDEFVLEEYLEEKLSTQARLKRKQAFARFKGKRNTAKKMKLKRASSPSQLKKRAIVAARRAMYQRLLRGRDKSALSATEKDRIEAQVKKLKNLQSVLANRLMPKIRSLEQKRLSTSATK